MTSILLTVFLIAGACSLAYQIIWIRMFGLVFGGTVVSMSVVVGVFMGGLALGSHVFGKIAVRVANRVRMFGFLELGLGTSAILVYFAIAHIAPVIYSLPFANDIHSFIGILTRILISSILLIVPTMIMGGTLPVLVRAITEDRQLIMGNTGILYAFNTLGAMLGAFMVGFLMIPNFGILRSNLIAASIEILMGVIALAISKHFQSTPDTIPDIKTTGEHVAADKGLRFVIALGITGFVGLTLEMVWMRIILLVVNNTIYVYTIVITSFLLYLGIGGLILKYLIPQKIRTERTFAVMLSLMSIFIAAGFVLFPVARYLFYIYPAVYKTFVRLSWTTAGFFFILAGIPVILMGMSFPIGMGLYAHEVKGLSSRLGFIYAVNTVGSLAGSLLAVFLLVPAIGMRGSTLLCSLMVMASAFYFFAKSEGWFYKVPVLAGSGIVLFIMFAISLAFNFPEMILRYKLSSEENIEYLKEGPSSTIWITGGERAIRKIWMDNLWISSTSTEGSHALSAHYPIIFHPNPKKVAGIAFGTGQTFGTCLLHPIDSMVSVEIDPEVIIACRGRFDKENFNILNNPRNRIVIDDGRFFLQGTSEKFDVITAEPLQPFTRGTVNLYTLEFYEACKRCLNPGGIVAQWIPTYNSGVSDTWSMIRTMAVVYDYCALFLNRDDAFVLGSDRPIRVDPTKQLPPEVIKDMTRVENGSIYAIAGNYICSREKLLKASEKYPIITDDKPTLEFTAPITHWAEDLSGPVEIRRQFLALLDPIEDVFVGDVDYETARKFRESRTKQSQGIIAEYEGNFDLAKQLYEEAFRLNPKDIKVIRSLFIFLGQHNRLDELPSELKIIQKRTSP
ncbi:hypothetical protein LLG96_12760 [bacterium]|nr:hypothetical protein [bacterium]